MTDQKTINRTDVKYQHESSFERRLEDFLKNKNIKYLREHILPGCVHIAQLYVDFYLPEHKVVIELDGPHHFIDKVKYINNEVSITDLKVVNARDISKNKYMFDNKIHLLRISHSFIKQKKQHFTDIIIKFLTMIQNKPGSTIMWFVGDDYCGCGSLKQLELVIAFTDQKLTDLIEISHNCKMPLILVDSNLYT
jgi:very-short-patch-repair endonuclease